MTEKLASSQTEESDFESSSKTNSSVEKAEEVKETKEAEKVKSASNKLPVFLSVIALACSIYNLSLTRNLTGNNLGNPGQIGRDSNSANFTEGSIASIANAVSKSVVSIVTSTDQKSFFSNETTSQTAAGTGFILSNDGYVATNKHVVSGASKIGVMMAPLTKTSSLSAPIHSTTLPSLKLTMLIIFHQLNLVIRKPLPLANKLSPSAMLSAPTKIL